MRSCRSHFDGELRPNAVAVVGAQISPRDGATGGLLNGSAVLDRDWPAACAPLIYERWGHAHTSSERRCADRSIPTEVVIQIHGLNYSVATVYSQAML